MPHVATGCSPRRPNPPVVVVVAAAGFGRFCPPERPPHIFSLVFRLVTISFGLLSLAHSPKIGPLQTTVDGTGIGDISGHFGNTL